MTKNFLHIQSYTVTLYYNHIQAPKIDDQRLRTLISANHRFWESVYRFWEPLCIIDLTNLCYDFETIRLR